jgi:hypothetical protein
MLISLLRNIVTLPLAFASRAAANLGNSAPFANVLGNAQDAYRNSDAALQRFEANPLFSMFGLQAGNASQLAHLRNFIRDAVKQQLADGGQFDAQKFQQDLAAQMRAMGFTDAEIQSLGSNLNRLFAELRALPAAQKHDLLEQLDASQDDTVTAAPDVGLRQ